MYSNTSLNQTFKLVAQLYAEEKQIFLVRLKYPVWKKTVICNKFSGKYLTIIHKRDMRRENSARKICEYKLNLDVCIKIIKRALEWCAREPDWVMGNFSRMAGRKSGRPAYRQHSSLKNTDISIIINNVNFLLMKDLPFHCWAENRIYLDECLSRLIISWTVEEERVS